MTLLWSLVLPLTVGLLLLAPASIQGKKRGRGRGRGNFLPGRESGQERARVEVRKGIPRLLHNRDGRLDLHRTSDETRIMMIMLEMELVYNWLRKMDDDPDMSPPDPNFYYTLHLPAGPYVPDNANVKEFRRAYKVAKRLARRALAETRASLLDIDMPSDEESNGLDEDWGTEDNFRRGIGEQLERRQSDNGTSNNDQGITSVIFDNKPPNPDFLDEGTPEVNNSMAVEKKWAITVNNAKQDVEDQEKTKSSKTREEILATLERLETSRRLQGRGQADQTASLDKRTDMGFDGKELKDNVQQEKQVIPAKQDAQDQGNLKSSKTREEILELLRRLRKEHGQVDLTASLDKTDKAEDSKELKDNVQQERQVSPAKQDVQDQGNLKSSKTREEILELLEKRRQGLYLADQTASLDKTDKAEDSKELKDNVQQERQVDPAKQDAQDQSKLKSSKTREEILELLRRLRKERGQVDKTASLDKTDKAEDSKELKDNVQQDRRGESANGISSSQPASRNFPDVGDFMFQSEDKSATRLSHPEKLSRQKRIIESDTNKRWPKAIVPYVFNSITDAKALNQIKVAMNKIEMYTCVRFVPWQQDVTSRQYGLGHEGHLNFIAGSGCWAVQGLSKDPNGQDISCCGWQTCVHELGHALGAGHEHVNIERDDEVKVNWDNIKDNMRIWYNKAYKGEYMPNILDLTNIMSYSDTTFNVDGRPTMTTLEKYGKFGQNTHYYFKEMVEAHDCKGLRCSNFNMNCENDGFVTYMNSECQCLCPPGLDPDTGCTSVIKDYVSPKTEWPSGRYSMLMPDSGCPATGQFLTGSYKQFSEGGNTRSSPSHLNGISGSEMTHQFCSRWSGASNSPTIANWTPGRYCIYRLGGSCPDGFNTAYAQFDDVMPGGKSSNEKTGTIPDGTYGANSRFEFCCREDGFDDMPLMVPTGKPFILFRTDYWAKCQEVPGMVGNQEYYVYDSADVEGLKPGFYGEPAKPQGMTWSNQVYFVYYCHYDKLFSNCGGYYELSNFNRQVTFSSPNYPSNYPSSARCTWFIKGPVNSKLFLTFSGFNIDPECKDALYISFENPGELPMKFCGGDGRLQGSLHSIRNTLLLTLETKPQTAGFGGFQATVKMVPEEELCYKMKDQGASYRGEKAYTRDFKRCLPWRDVAHCQFSVFTTIDDDHGLEENYCRNPGLGRRPWCYVTAETCERGYCDACNLDQVRDTLDDCEDQKRQGRCREPDVALSCAASCSGNLPFTVQPRSVRDVTCPRPPSLPDSSQSGFGTKVGDTVTYTCNSGSGSVTSTCLSNGQWSNVGYTCGGCSSGWTYSAGSCYRYFPESLNTIEARKICAQENNGIISPARNPTEIAVLGKLRVENVRILVGLGDEEQEGVYVWSDGSKATNINWREGEPNNYYNEDCGVLDADGKFGDGHCIAHKQPFICRTAPSGRKTCVDRLPYCNKLYGQRPSMCTDFPDFATLMCPSTCGVCWNQNFKRALDDADMEGEDDKTDTTTDTPGKTGEGGVQCKVPPLTKGAKARRIKGRTTLRQGRTVTYQCYMAYTLSSGNLQRGCQANGSLTGEPPQCIKLSRAVTQLNKVELFARQSFGEPGHSYTGPAPTLLIRRTGQVTQWRFFSSDSRQVALQVWRPHPEKYGYGFQIIGQTLLTTRPDQLNVVDLADGQRIPVQPGDTVGVWYGPGDGGVTFDVCEQTSKPQGAPVFMLEVPQQNLTGSGIFFFEETANCFIFSLTATIGPMPE